MNLGKKVGLGCLEGQEVKLLREGGRSAKVDDDRHLNSTENCCELRRQTNGFLEEGRRRAVEKKNVDVFWDVERD